jgi:hypothetical protein
MAKKGQVSVFEEQKKHKPTAEGLAEDLLDGEMQEGMLDLLSFLNRSRLKPQWYATGSFKSSCKGKPVVRIQIGHGGERRRNSVFVLVYFAGVAETEQFGEYLLGNREAKELFFGNVDYCRHCSRCAPGRTITVLGRTLENVCHNYSLRFTDPGRRQFEHIGKLVGLRKQFIARQNARNRDFRQRVREAWQSLVVAPAPTHPWRVGSNTGRSHITYLERSEEITGYRVWVWRREPFVVAGYTAVLPPGADVKAFWDGVVSDGRLERLAGASSVQAWVLGLGSWDPECEPNGMRYTIGLEETADTDFSSLAREEGFFRKEIGASEWLCFETEYGTFPERFWRHDPYRMMGKLDYAFHAGPGDYSVGLHFDAYPPGFFPEKGSPMEFWITVVKAGQ